MYIFVSVHVFSYYNQIINNSSECTIADNNLFTLAVEREIRYKIIEMLKGDCSCEYNIYIFVGQ